MGPSTASSPKPRLAPLILVCSALAMVGATWLSQYPQWAAAAVFAVLAIAVGWATSTRFEQVTLLLIAARTLIDITHGGGESGLLRPAALITGAYTLAAGIWLFRSHGKHPIRVSSLTVSVGIFTMAALTSAALSEDQATAFTAASKWVFLTVFVLVLENLIVDRRSVDRLLVAVGLSAIVPLSMGIWQFLDAAAAGGVSRIEGSFSHPNTYGFYLVTLGLLITAVFRHLRPLQRSVAGGLLVLVLLSLLATYSRSSYVAFGAGLVVLIFAGRRWVLFAVAVLGVAGALLFPGVAERLADVGEATTVRGTPGDSLAWRVDYWGDVIEAGDGRRVTGLGLGVTSESTEEGREPHNDFLRAFVETGTIGLAAYLGLIAVLGRRTARSYRSTARAFGVAGLPRGLAEGFMAIFVAYLVAGVVSNLMTQLILLWYVLAIGVVATAPHIKGQRIVRRRALAGREAAGHE